MILHLVILNTLKYDPDMIALFLIMEQVKATKLTTLRIESFPFSPEETYILLTKLPNLQELMFPGNLKLNLNTTLLWAPQFPLLTCLALPGTIWKPIFQKTYLSRCSALLYERGSDNSNTSMDYSQ